MFELPKQRENLLKNGNLVRGVVQSGCKPHWVSSSFNSLYMLTLFARDLQGMFIHCHAEKHGATLCLLTTVNIGIRSRYQN